MRVIHENVLIEIEKTDNKSDNLILEEDKKASNIGIVVGIGEALSSKQPLLQFNLQDKIKFKEYFNGERFIYQNKEFVVIHYTDILVIF